MNIISKKSIKKYLGVFVLLSTSIALLNTSEAAEERHEKEQTKNEWRNKEMQQINDSRLEDLHKKLNLQPAQGAAWTKWSTTLLAEIKDQYADDVKLFESWDHETNEGLSTPDRITHQETHVKNHIARMQHQLERLEAGRLNAVSFYTALSKDQQTIFDMFWSESSFRHEHMH